MANFKLADNVNVLTDFVDGYTIYDARYALVSHAHAHDDLTELTDDDHSQYALLAGRSGGQTLIGGTASGNDLTLHSTSHGTKGTIFLGSNSAYDQVNDRLGIGVTAPTKTLDLRSVEQPFFKGVYTGASGAGVGPAIDFFADDGAGLASGDRIGAFQFGGAFDGTHDLRASALILAKTTEAWSSTARGAQLQFFTTPNGSISSAAVCTYEQDGSVTFAGEIEIDGALNHDGTTVGFYGVTPVTRPAAITQTYATTATTLTQATMTDPAAYAAGANGYSTGAMAQAIHAEVIALHANMIVTQNVLNYVIDSLQSQGLLQ